MTTDEPKKRFDRDVVTNRMNRERVDDWHIIEATSMANAKRLAQNHNSHIKQYQKEKGTEMYRHFIVSSCNYEGTLEHKGLGAYSVRVKLIKIDDREPAAIKSLTKPPRSPPPASPVKKLHGYIYASYNRSLGNDMSLSQPYTIDYDRTDPIIAENQKYHSNREALSIIVTKQPLSAYDIQHWVLTDIIAENKQQSLIAYIRTLDLKWTTEQALIGVIENGNRIQNRADVDKYVCKFEPKRKAPTKPPRTPAPSVPEGLGGGGIPPIPGMGAAAAPKPKQAAKPAKKATAPKPKSKAKNGKPAPAGITLTAAQKKRLAAKGSITIKRGGKFVTVRG